MALLTPEDDGSLATCAGLSALSPFGFNDIVVDGHGNIVELTTDSATPEWAVHPDNLEWAIARVRGDDPGTA